MGAGTLLVVLALGGWLYFTGRLGFGPLSAKDEAAAEEIAGSIEAPGWADDDAVACAADELVSDTRSKGLEENGTIEESGDGWRYTEKWKADHATRFGEGLLHCTDDWESEVADAWGLHDDDCLSDIGSESMSEFFAADLLPVDDGDFAEKAKADAVKELDDCYVTDPEAPKGKAKPGYRSVKFTFQVPEIENAKATVQVGSGGEFEPLDGKTHSVETDEGGERVCVSVQTKAQYAWGTTGEAENEVCGKARPKKLWWTRGSGCDGAPAGWTCWNLKYEGFKDFELVTVTFTEDGGGCSFESGSCTLPLAATEDNGRGNLFSYAVPPGYDRRFVAKAAGLEAALPN